MKKMLKMKDKVNQREMNKQNKHLNFNWTTAEISLFNREQQMKKEIFS